MLKKEETILKEIFWGERPAHHLSFVKIKHSVTPEGLPEIENPRDLNVVCQAVDIARGLLRYYREPEKLKSWALLILFTPEIFPLDLAPPEEKVVLEKALGEVAEGKPLPEDALTLAKTLVPTFPKKRFLGEPDSSAITD